MSGKAKIAREYERRLWGEGYHRVAGIDEAGRGALAGPVVAAAIILPEEFSVDGVRDSKLIPEAEREDLYEEVVGNALAWNVGWVDNGEIDRINILQATFLAMRLAVEGLPIAPDYALIDGRDEPDVGVPAKALIKGDSLSQTIAAASIVAKVTRDRFMRDQDQLYGLYGFTRNKGYGTKEHREAILNHGTTPLHRTTFLTSLLQTRLSL